MVATIPFDAYAVALSRSEVVWKVPSDMVSTIDGVQFVKVKPYDQSLVQMICDGLVAMPKGTKRTIAGCAGFIEVM